MEIPEYRNRTSKISVNRPPWAPAMMPWTTAATMKASSARPVIPVLTSPNMGVATLP